MTTPAQSVYNARYELREQIGRGGTAQVYLARDLLLDRPVALKVLISELSRDPSFVERFRREAQAAANLSHPNIVSVYDWGESEETYFIVMEYVDGESLASIVRTEAPLDPIQASSIGADIASALSYAHRHGVVHRDVKPGNVLITADGQIKVTDFGIARAIGVDDQMTQTGLVMGTATYFSPEQAQGLGVDGRSDVYSLGVVLYEMVVGRPPFHGENPVSIAYQHVRENPPTPRSVNPNVPLALEAIILQAIAKLPAERYATADELRADLGRFVHGQPVLARPPGGATGDMTAAISRTAGPETTASSAVDANGGRASETDEPVTRTTRWWVLAGTVLAVALAIVIYVLGHDLGYFGGGSFERVPDVTFTSRTHAESVLKAKGFKYRATSTVGNGHNTNQVYRQVPDFPTTERKGSLVKLFYYTAPTKATVPPVTQLTVVAAENALRAAGFVPVINPVKANVPGETQGTVVDEKPQAGTSLHKGRTVTISVIEGKANVTVPNVAGDTPIIAGNVLGNAGFTYGTATQGFSSTVPVGDIVSTSPAAGKSEPPGTRVNVEISRGPGVVLPNVVGLPVDQADLTLSQAGVTVTPTTRCDDSAPANEEDIVISQFPDYVAGRTISPTHPVILLVGCMPTSSTTTTTTTTTIPPTSTTAPPGPAPLFTPYGGGPRGGWGRGRGGF